MAPKKKDETKAEAETNGQTTTELPEGQATATAAAKAPLSEGSLDEAAVAADPKSYTEELLEMLPDDERKLPGALLFAEACVAYGIDANPDVFPVEVLSSGDRRWKFYPGNRNEGTPDRVRFVTAGGLKVAHPMDEEFHQRLSASVFRTTRMNANQVVEYELPENLTLPKEHVTGQIPKNAAHVFPQGYLRQRAQDAARRR